MNRFFLLLLIYSFGFLTALAQEDDDACPVFQSKKTKKAYDEAFQLMQNRQTKDAFIMFKDVIKMEPEVADPYFYLGYICLKVKQDVACAENYFTQALERCPEVDPYLNYYLGSIYYGREDWAGASKCLKEFLSDPALIDDDAILLDAKDLYKWSRIYGTLYGNPVPFNPRYLDGVCSKDDEILPSISPDGELAFYTRRFEMPPRKDDLVGKPYLKEILYVSNLASGHFDSGREMDYPFNNTSNIGGITVTLDNSKLFVAIGEYDADNYNNVDIYYTFKDSDGYWVDLMKVPGINGPKTWETMPSIASDGKTLYFVSDRPGGFGAGDIWVTTQDDTGKWSEPQNLGPAINTPGEEKTPFIHTDSQTLYFSSGDLMSGYGPGHPGVGGLDIFFSRLNENGVWSEPKNLGYPINTEKDESGFFVSLDGKKGYYTSNQLNGPGGYDVYEFDLYKDARPESMALIKGTVKQEDNKDPVKARVEITNVVTKRITEIPVDSVTGKYIAAIVFRNDFVMTVKKEDYAYESKYVAKEDTLESEPIEVDFEIKAIEVGKSYRLNDIFFPTNSYDLLEESRSVLDGFFVFLQENPDIRVSIEGHTDNVGQEEDNMELSTNRAHSVYQFLVEKGISEERLLYKGFGESKPVASNDTPDGRARNRRTEFVIIAK